MNLEPIVHKLAFDIAIKRAKGDDLHNLICEIKSALFKAMAVQAKQDLEDLEEQGDSLLYFAEELLINHKLGNRVIKDENTRKKYIHDYRKSAEGIE